MQDPRALLYSEEYRRLYFMGLVMSVAANLIRLLAREEMIKMIFGCGLSQS